MKSSRAARIVIVAIVACTITAIVPRLLSVTVLPSPTFTQTNLISDVPGMARTTDPNLVNPWGLTLGLNSGIWVSDNGTGKATTYDGAGRPIPTASPLVVTIPAPGGSTDTSAPTGVATNATGGFVISAGAASGPSAELFA